MEKDIIGKELPNELYNHCHIEIYEVHHFLLFFAPL